MHSGPGSLLDILRANDGLIVAVGLCIGPPLVLALVALIVRSSGASLKPVVFVGVFMLPIVLTFLVGHLVLARLPASVSKLTTPGLPVQDGQFADREKLFGGGISPQMIRDAKSGLPGILDEAVVAEVGMTMGGESALIAQFPDEAAAQRAAAAYHRGFQLRNTSGDEGSGWRATRMQGDFIEMLRAGRHLFVWTGLTKEAAAARRAATDVSSRLPALTPAPRPPAFPALQPLGDFFAPVPMKIAGLLLVGAICIGWFFKGAGWAGSMPPAAGAAVVGSHELAARLMAVNQLDVPFSVTPGSQPDEFFADWRYADAKWIDLARARGMRRTFRIKLTLDEPCHTVRATDYFAVYDWSAGRGGADLDWKGGTGIVFFQKEQQTVIGLQFDEHGRPKAKPAYTFKFDLNEMKSPVITAVTRAGWTWRPTVWQGPKWLRWLTE
ncbi:MAG: hypothetical protein K1X78_27940 [Verrucomicrobiaceae bacterium]|nr:hypothetical protein [Verrucomicrobiaceae bacterium]